MESKQVPWLGRSSHTVGNRSKVCKPKRAQKR